MATSYTLAGTAKARGLGSVDPRLVQIIAAAAERSPYQVQIFSGKRAGSQGGSRHNSGNALDIALIDPTTGQVVPNYKSSTGFPIYAEFAKVAREEQMRLAPDMADQFRWGGGFSDKSFDLMHFDFKPGGAMAYWTWQDGGKLTPAGERDVPKFGAGYVYANGERYKAPPGQYASLWGREPLQAQPQPQDAQSAIASLIAPSGGTAIPEAPTAAMGFAPTIPDAGFGAPPAASQPDGPPPLPQPPPQWAQAGGFPMDEALTGSSAQDVLAGGPRLDPRRAIGSAPVGPTTDQGVLDMGPNLRPPGPQVDMPTPPMRPGNFVFNGGGAPDAGTVPSPPMRPDPFASTFPPRPEGPAAGMPPAALADGMSAAMGGPPALPAPALRTDGGQELLGPGNATGRSRFDNFQTMQDMAARDAQFSSDQQSRMLAGDLGFQRKQMERYVPDYRAPSPQTMGERFDTAAPMPNADQMFGLPPMNGASFPGPDPVVGTAEAGSTTGEWFTPAPPMPAPPPDPMAARFNDAFSPGGPGMIADLQGAFNRQQAPPPPTATAQDGISQIFGAPPAPAAVPNLAIPFAEVPTGPAPPMPSMAPPAPISRSQFDDRFGGGTVVPDPPKPGQPGVVSGEMPSPGGAPPPSLPPAPGALPAPAPAMPAPAPRSAPRQPDPGAERQRNSILGRVLGGLLGGPIGALGGGLLGGNGAGFGFGGQPTYAWTGGGSSAPYGNGGTTTYQKGTSNALGGSNALSWKGSGGQQITVVQDPWTGTYYGPTTTGGGLY